jgi:hypothetical protein
VRSEDVVGTLDQQTSEIGVAGLGDAELRIPITGLAASRSQTEVAADIATLLEAFLATQGQDERRCRDRTNHGPSAEPASLDTLSGRVAGSDGRTP